MFDLQGLLNLLFGYPIGFISNPYLDNHNKKIQDILLKNNCVSPTDLGYNPETMTPAEIAAFEQKANDAAIKYQTLRDDLTHKNTNSLDHSMYVLDSDKGLLVLFLSGVLYYFNRDKISFGKYLLIMSGVAAGGVAVAKIKNNQADAKHNADLTALKASENTATQYGKPYSLDLTKIKTYPVGHYMAGQLYYDDPKWNTLSLEMTGGGYYLGDGGVPQQQWFMYNLKDGSWSNTWGNPSIGDVPGNDNNKDGLIYSSNNQQ